MKPHQETWEQYESGIANHGIYRKNPRCTVATRIKTHDEAMLLSAAPEMARALVELLARIESEGPADVSDPLYDAGRDALRKAGVL